MLWDNEHWNSNQPAKIWGNEIKSFSLRTFFFFFFPPRFEGVVHGTYEPFLDPRVIKLKNRRTVVKQKTHTSKGVDVTRLSCNGHVSPRKAKHAQHTNPHNLNLTLFSKRSNQPPFSATQLLSLSKSTFVLFLSN